MSELLPIIEDLAAAPDDAARARWLLSAPQIVLARHHLTIRAVLSKAGFSEGLTALEAEIAALSAVRRNGSIPTTRRLAREYTRIGLTLAARRERAQ